MELATRGQILLPRTSVRNEKDCFIKLLSRVDPAAEHGFGFEGVLFRAGATVSRAQLWPNESFPEVPILLEYLRGPAYGPVGRHRRDQVYILWRFEPETLGWAEIARASSHSWEWAVELRPIAIRALREARRSELRPKADVSVISERIAEFLDRELAALEAADRVRVLAALHDQLASRMVA